MVIREVTLQPGFSGTVTTSVMMHKGMEGPHLFEAVIKSNDPRQPETRLRIKGNFIVP
ncbi:MAG: hypothetical protein HYY96_12485 [Candidatus Tectomicrobia bacterium]|nr:hypothetical protein [Candidatus Tectomicrobia bacterium]